MRSTSLPEDLRIAVVLRDVADLDYAEIAEVLDVPDRHGEVPDLAWSRRAGEPTCGSTTIADRELEGTDQTPTNVQWIRHERRPDSARERVPRR